MNNKTKIITAVVGVIAVGLGVSLMQPKTSDIQEPIMPVVEETQEVKEPIDVDVDFEEEIETFEETEEVEEVEEEIGESETIEVVEPTTVAVAELEPTTVAVVEPEPTPVAVVEPEPTPVVVAEPEPVVEVAQVAETYTGQTYTTVYNGVTYTVTQEQLDASRTSAGYKKTDGIPAMVFIQIDNVGFSTGTSNLTTEEFRDLLENPTVENHGAVVWS